MDIRCSAVADTSAKSFIENKKQNFLIDTVNLILKSKALVIGLIIIGIMLVLALFPSVFTKFDPNYIDGNAIMLSPCATHWFGTDMYGRDLFSRVILCNKA